MSWTIFSFYFLILSSESVGNGCPKERNQTTTSRPQVAAVRCCNMNDCVTPKGPNECFKVTLDQAEEECAKIQRRLCTPDELNGNKCCRSGCGFDLELTWQKKDDGLFFGKFAMKSSTL